MNWGDALFRPRRIGVVGSVGEGKIGRILIDQLCDGGFERVVAVNPKAQGVETHNVPGIQSFREWDDARDAIDLAVIASPASTVAEVVRDAGAAGVCAAVIITAGFSESGNASEERALLRAAKESGIRLVGPNCAGIVNTKHRLFPTLETRPPSGDVAFISQSGALGGAVLSWAEEQDVGFSKFVSYGNAADLTEVDLLELLREDEETRVVALYIETVSDGRRFMKAACALTAEKPLIVIKSGRSESGGRATQSHTGSMAGADAVYDAALKQCGAIRVSGIEEMFDVCRGFTMLPPVRGSRVAIVTNSGGPGVLATDTAEARGLCIEGPSDRLRADLVERLPGFYSMGNPFDLTVQGTEAEYRETLVSALAEYDAAVALNVNTPYLDSAPLARGIVEAAEKADKPIAASFMAGRPAQAALPVLKRGGVPNFATGERAVTVFAHLRDFETWRSTPRTAATDRGTETGTSELLPWNARPTEPEAMAWLRAMGFPVIPHRFATSADDAVEAARSLDSCVAMKIVSSLVLHKTDVGGVQLNLRSESEIRSAYDKIQGLVPSGAMDGVLISPMLCHPVEAIVGLSQDPQFGPVVAVGLGGIYTEVFQDIQLRVAPIFKDEAHEMIERLRGIALLKGARGGVLRDLDALADVVSRVSELPFQYAGLVELDLNPVFLQERGCLIGDVRVIPNLGGGSTKERSIA